MAFSIETRQQDLVKRFRSSWDTLITSADSPSNEQLTAFLSAQADIMRAKLPYQGVFEQQVIEGQIGRINRTLPSHPDYHQERISFFDDLNREITTELPQVASDKRPRLESMHQATQSYLNFLKSQT